jgi:hypothetical protein
LPDQFDTQIAKKIASAEESTEAKPFPGQSPLPRRLKGELAETASTLKPNINITQQKRKSSLENPVLEESSQGSAGTAIPEFTSILILSLPS